MQCEINFAIRVSASDDNLDGRTYLGLYPLLNVEFWAQFHNFKIMFLNLHAGLQLN